jgi:ATP-binding cassette, subfamily C, bacterial LapB
MNTRPQTSEHADQTRDGGTVPLSQTAGLLYDVLVALGGHRTRKVFESALPKATGDLSTTQLAEVAYLMGVMAEISHGIPTAWQNGLDGALIGEVDGRAIAVARLLGKTRVIAEGSVSVNKALGKIARSHRILHLRTVSEADAGKLRFISLRNRASRIARHVFWQSLLINGLALSVPFFSMAVYDRVLGGGAVSTLPALLMGALVVLVTLIVLRLVRSRLVAEEYSRLKALMEILVLQRLSRQGANSRLRPSPERQLSVARNASGAADVFSSANLMAIFDSPFLLLTLFAVLVVGGSLALVPLLFLLLFFGAALLLDGGRSSVDPEIAAQSGERQIRIAELERHGPEIQRSGLTKAWLSRFEQITIAAARDGMRVQRKSGALQAVGFFMGTATALATLVVGLDLALQGHLSPGVLIGTMLLTWRITGPAQALFLGLPRLRTIKASWSRLENLLLQPSLSSSVQAQEAFPEGAPEIEARGLFYRYEGSSVPAITGVSFKVEPGQIVAVIGANGSGKSALFRMLAGKIPTQSGNLLVNGRTISQFDPDDMNLRMGYLASGFAEESEGDCEFITYNQEVAIERRAWDSVVGKKSHYYYLLDDPLAVGGQSSHDLIRDFLQQARGNATVFFSTHDTSLVELADVALVLDHGAAAYFGPVQRPENTSDQTISVSQEAT